MQGHVMKMQREPLKRSGEITERDKEDSITQSNELT